MSTARLDILAWTERVASTLERARDDDFAQFASATADERWKRIQAACAAAAAVLEHSPSRERIEEDAARDHARWARIAAAIRQRHDG